MNDAYAALRRAIISNERALGTAEMHRLLVRLRELMEAVDAEIDRTYGTDA